MTNTPAALLLCAAAILAACGMDEPSEIRQTKIKCYCAVDDDNIAPLMRAYRDADVQALAGLLERKKALELDAETSVGTLFAKDGATYIRIQNGFHSGEKCFVPTGFLK